MIPIPTTQYVAYQNDTSAWSFSGGTLQTISHVKVKADEHSYQGMTTRKTQLNR